jgi:hypothetical protein
LLTPRCNGIKPICDNCNKRGIECTFDDHVRRRGPGKRTKVQRDRSRGDVADAGYGSSSIDIAQDGLQPEFDENGVPLDNGEQDLGEMDHQDLLLDPALAGETGDSSQTRDEVMEAMGALKQAGIDLGLHVNDLGEPTTLAELGQLSEEFANHHGHQFGEEDEEESRKRKSDLLDFGDFQGVDGVSHDLGLGDIGHVHGNGDDDGDDGHEHKRSRLDDAFRSVLDENGVHLALQAHAEAHENGEELVGDGLEGEDENGLSLLEQVQDQVNQHDQSV